MPTFALGSSHDAVVQLKCLQEGHVAGEESLRISNLRLQIVLLHFIILQQAHFFKNNISLCNTSA